RPVGGRLAQQRRKGLCQKEGGLEVQVHDLVPAVLREVVKRRTPGCAGVVDQDVQLTFVPGKSRHQGVGSFQCGHVSRQRDAVALAGELLGGLVAGGTFSCRDVNPRTLRQKACGNHATDAARAAGDQGGAASKGKKIFHIRSGWGEGGVNGVKLFAAQLIADRRGEGSLGRLVPASAWRQKSKP